MIGGSGLKSIDSGGMYGIYDKWPSMAEESYRSGHEKIDFQDVRDVVFAGMGGSGTIGDVFAAILSKTDMHVTTVKGYLLPKTTTKDTLVLATSVSGNTAETITVLREAMRRGCRVAGFSSGGALERMCARGGAEHRRMARIHSPRTSFVTFLYGMLEILLPILPVRDDDVRRSLAALRTMGGVVRSSNMTETNPARNLAEWIRGTPMVYYPFGLQAAAVRFKNSLQENAKMHAAVEDIIESCHNGIVSWERLSPFQPILIQGSNDYVKTKERWRVLKEYFDHNGIGFWEVHSIRGGILSKIVALIYMLDCCSILCAAKNGVDPSPVRSIDFVKGRI